MWRSCVSPGPVNYDAAHSSGGEQDTEPHRRSSSHRQAGGRVEREMGEAMTTSPLVPVSTDFLPLVRRLQAMRSILTICMATEYKSGTSPGQPPQGKFHSNRFTTMYDPN